MSIIEETEMYYEEERSLGGTGYAGHLDTSRTISKKRERRKQPLGFAPPAKKAKKRRKK